MNKFILSIDIGITNLGFVYSQICFDDNFSGSKYKNLLLNSDYKFNKETMKNNVRIIHCNRIDITKVQHRVVSRNCCKLLHENCIPDYLDHFIQEHQILFDKSDVILLERQPPVGITNVQDLLFKQFRNKVKMISPNTVHKYFGLSGDYLLRKQESEKISKPFLCDFKNFKDNIRKHDISDALLMILYYYKIETDNIIENTVYLSNCTLFDEFKYF